MTSLDKIWASVTEFGSLLWYDFIFKIFQSVKIWEKLSSNRNLLSGFGQDLVPKPRWNFSQPERLSCKCLVEKLEK